MLWFPIHSSALARFGRTILPGILCVFSASCATKSVTILFRAPIDGHVLSAPSTNATFEGGRSRSQETFDAVRLRQSVAPRYEQWPAHPSGGVASPVIQITSDALELQYREQVVKVTLAEQRLALAESTLALEHKLRAPERDKVGDQALVTQMYVQTHTTRELACIHEEHPHYHCTAHPDLHAMAASGRRVQEGTVMAFNARQDHQFVDLEKRVAMAKDELQSSRISLDIIRGTIELGEVTCPQSCVIDRVLVIPGQYVTKGSPMLRVTFPKQRGE